MQNRVFYAYLDIDNPIVAWEVAIGRLCSADELIKEQVLSLSQWHYSRLRHYVISGSKQLIKNEIKLESVRLKFHPNCVSRLRGLYFFESKTDAEAAIDSWNINQSKKRYISEVGFSVTNISQHDTEWITFNLASSDDETWMRKYWQGEVCCEKPLWEFLATGVGLVWDQDLRIEAYKRVMHRDPTSVPILRLSCIAFHLGYERVAQVVPYLLKQGNKVKGTYIINMRDFENSSPLFNSLNEYKGDYPPLPDNWNGEITVGDFKEMMFECDVNELLDLSEAKPLTSSSSNALKNIHDFHNPSS